MPMIMEFRDTAGRLQIGAGLLPYVFYNKFTIGANAGTAVTPSGPNARPNVEQLESYVIGNYTGPGVPLVAVVGNKKPYGFIQQGDDKYTGFGIQSGSCTLYFFGRYQAASSAGSGLANFEIWDEATNTVCFDMRRRPMITVARGSSVDGLITMASGRQWASLCSYPSMRRVNNGVAGSPDRYSINTGYTSGNQLGLASVNTYSETTPNQTGEPQDFSGGPAYFAAVDVTGI